MNEGTDTIRPQAAKGSALQRNRQLALDVGAHGGNHVGAAVVEQPLDLQAVHQGDEVAGRRGGDDVGPQGARGPGAEVGAPPLA